MASSHRLAMELIAYQTDGFKKRLVSEVEALMECSSGNVAQSSKALSNIEKFVLDRTGVRLKLYVNFNVDSADAATGWPQIDPEFLSNCHVLRPNPSVGGYSPGIIRAMQGKKSNFVGVVDYKNARLKGDYTKIEFPVRFSFMVMKHFNLAPAQVAGMIMHEVGHAWTIMATSWATARASYFLAGIRDTFVRGGEVENVQHIITELGDVLAKENLIDNQLEIGNAKDYATISTLVYTEVFRKVSSDIGTRASSAHQAESLADVFATRFGFGEDLGSVIRGFEWGQTPRYGGPLVLALAVGALCTVALPLGVGAGIVALAGSILASGHTEDGSKENEVYGSDKSRVNRIRLTIIDVLKSNKLKGEVRRDLLEQERSLSSLLRTMNEGNDLLSDIANTIFPSRRATAAAIKLEQELESLMANDLFVSGHALQAAARS